MVFGSVFMGNSDTANMVGDLPLSQALCLPISPQEVIAASNTQIEAYSEQVQKQSILFVSSPLTSLLKHFFNTKCHRIRLII